MNRINRRLFMQQTALGAASVSMFISPHAFAASRGNEILKGVYDFLQRVANEDGSFRPGIDPLYKGTSDTYYTGIAAPTYAVILCETFGWPLPYLAATKEFYLSSQKPDGAFHSRSGAFDPNTPQAKFYNTAQSLVALRFLGEKPKYDPASVIDFFFQQDEFDKLPLYMTSFFPYFYSALGKPMPREYDRRLREYMEKKQTDDGYIGDHVASAFHMVHYYRLVGAPVPKAEAMIERVLRDQQNNGSWCHHPPDWDVHAVFDALFMMRQIGNPDDPRIRSAYDKAVQFVLQCRNDNGGFGHFPNYTSDVDAVYFHVGALVQAGFLQPRSDLKNEEFLGWGHAMIPGKHYSCVG
jgi:geranylgeranyl transferase type-2 subunit beta